MRILYVITDLQTGGVPLHLYRLARHARGSGLHVHVTCLSPPGPVSRMLEELGIPTSACGAAGVWDWRVLDRLVGILADVRPDLVHSFLFHANVACRFAGVLGGFPANRLICEIQTVEIERRWHLTVERLTHRLCRYVVGNSRSVIEHLARHTGIGEDRLVLVQGGIDPAPIRNAAPADRRSLGLRDATPVLLWIGRLDAVKGLDTLIAAAAIVNRAIPIQVLLVGEGAERERIASLVRQAGLADRVVLPGRRTDVPNLLQLADVFVFPSLSEGMPNALLEAMAAGLPVVATDVPGNRDLIDNGASGLLVPPRDSRRLAEATAILLQDRSLAKRLGTAASRRVDTYFHTRHTHERYLSLYERTIRLCS